jgi:hypothetical protein
LGPLLARFIVDATGSYQWGIAFALAAGTLGFTAVAQLRIPRDEGIGRPPRSPLRSLRHGRRQKLGCIGLQLNRALGVSRPALILNDHLFCPETAVIFVCQLLADSHL